MARVIIKFRVMPADAEADLGLIKSKLKEEIENFGGSIHGEMTEDPVAFGLKSIGVSFTYDEAKGTTDDLEDSLCEDENIQSVEVVSVGRTMG
ncbi:MAG: elongation factor 1-beta [Nanoarchaeota archaeon]|nr:elongation factor 1-beta [Nanoarchaeota archaeon]